MLLVYLLLYLFTEIPNERNHVTLSIHSPGCVTVHPPPALRTTPICSFPAETSWPLQRYESVSCFWWAAELLETTVHQLSSLLTSIPSCVGHFGQLCTIREGHLVRGSHPHRPKNKTVSEQSGSCRTFTLGFASRHAGARVLTM